MQCSYRPGPAPLARVWAPAPLHLHLLGCKRVTPPTQPRPHSVSGLRASPGWPAHLTLAPSQGLQPAPDPGATGATLRLLAGQHGACPGAQASRLGPARVASCHTQSHFTSWISPFPGCELDSSAGEGRRATGLGSLCQTRHEPPPRACRGRAGVCLKFPFPSTPSSLCWYPRLSWPPVWP